ncbi:type II toxin-antitoxin system HicB family antitoxin, partial [Aromatoleum aromaticum]|uniref:type II toxin-antitoxin system HicB family antitoxin n=1 Tax=Aromatoleum aromaticum TaxID=551760 RepID=UPI003D083C49
MNTMTHKGYTARIEFDERDNIFVGRVLGLRVMISFHGETVAELHEAFAGAIEDFLSDGTSQDSCRLIHATNRPMSSACKWSRTTASRSGLSVTAPIGVQ